MKRILLFLSLVLTVSIGYGQGSTGGGRVSTSTAKQYYATERIVSYGSRATNSTTLSDGVATTETSRVYYKSNGNSSDIRVDYYNQQRPGGVTVVFNDVTITADLEYPANTFYRLKFVGGQDTYLLKAGAYITTDPLPIEIPAGAQYWIRTNVLVTSGQKWLKGWATAGSTTYPEGVITGSDLTGSGTIANSSTFCFSPYAIHGVSANRQGSIALLGNSIASGQNDIVATPPGYMRGGGIFGRGFPADTWNTLSLNVSGDKSLNWQTATRLMFFNATKYCSHAVMELATNDIATPTTLATLQSYTINICDNLYARNVQTYVTTVTPRTTSSDAWATTTNQTVLATEPVRVAYNTWLRDLAPMDKITRVPVSAGTTTPTTVRMGQLGHPMAGYLEIANTVETAQNSGIWIAPNGTVDGLHGTSTSYPLMAVPVTNAITAGKFNVY